MAKPAPKTPTAKHDPAPAAKPNNNAKWRDVGNARPIVSTKPSGRSDGNSHFAQNTTVNTNRSNGTSRNSHFGGRR